MQRYGLRKEDFLTVIDGMDMDVAADIVAPDLKALDAGVQQWFEHLKPAP